MDTTPVPEPHICRFCLEGEEDGNVNILMELRCRCRGDMSRMHKHCILKRYGLRMILDNRFKCELCKAILHRSTQQVVKQAVSDHENQGRDILLTALEAKLPPPPPRYPDVDLESAATYKELVELVDWRQNPYPMQIVRALPAPALMVNVDVPHVE